MTLLISPPLELLAYVQLKVCVKLLGCMLIDITCRLQWKSMVQSLGMDFKAQEMRSSLNVIKIH